MKTKMPKKMDIAKAKKDLLSAIKERDPMQKWLPILNELKSEIEDAKNQGLSVTQIRKILTANGINLPAEVLKKFMNISESK